MSSSTRLLLNFPITVSFFLLSFATSLTFCQCIGSWLKIIVEFPIAFSYKLLLGCKEVEEKERKFFIFVSYFL